MTELIERIGELAFLRVVIEGWNEVFLLILISIMMKGIRHDKTDASLKNEDTPYGRVADVFCCGLCL